MRISTFDLPPDWEIAGKYQVVLKLGSGWEGEVYKIREIRTGIERAAKLFYPHRNPNNRTAKRYAKKLHKLRHCAVLIQYHTEEFITYNEIPVTALVSEYVEGELLSHFLQRLPGKRLQPFEALHLLHSLAKGIEQIHLLNEYHGDLHSENIIVKRFGLTFDLKLIDLFHWESSKSENRQADICDLIRLFYESLGGTKFYQRQPDAVKYICSGMKHSTILRKFRTISHLLKHLETMEW
ncbi:MAG: protein kinase [bacterium]